MTGLRFTRRVTAGAVALGLVTAAVVVGHGGVAVAAPTAGVRAYLVIAAPGDLTSIKNAVVANGGSVVNAHPAIGVIAAQSSATDFAAKMLAVSGVQKAAQTREVDVPAAGTAPLPARTLPNPGTNTSAPAETATWNLTQINADKAWAVNTGSRDVEVAVLDSGVEGTHEDLKDNFDATNSVSCEYGRNNTASGAWQPSSPSTYAGHGTSVAGIIAAAKNGRGVAGVAPNVRVTSVKIMEDTDYMYAENVVCGIMWAADHGAKVMNHSYFVDPWKYNSTDNASQATVIEAVRRAIDYSAGKGVVNVGIAGNESANHDTIAGLFLPSDLDNVIGVSAFTHDRKLAPYSNWGLDSVDLTAPGADWTTRISTTGVNNSYVTDFNGTSAAAPHVAGVVALLRSTNPTATPAQIKTLLLSQANDVPCPASDTRGCTGPASRNSFFGEGLTDALKAVGGAKPETVVYSENFDGTTQAWKVNPNNSDTATAGRFEIGTPQQTTYGSLVMQPGTTPSGTKALVTGAAAGSDVGANDLDGGTTTAQSPAISVPATGKTTLSLKYFLGYLSNSAGADWLRVRVVSGTDSVVVVERKTTSTDTAAAWSAATADLSPWAGKSVRVVVEAADLSAISLVEAGVDDVRVTNS